MDLKHKRILAYSVEYADLEELILDTFGHDYEIMLMEEVGSSQYAATYEQKDITGEVLTPTTRAVLSDEQIQFAIDDHRKVITGLREGRPEQFILRSIMIELCALGLIQPGDYIINVNW